jgi:chemotaxis protein methyltransferase CheR
MSDHDCVSFLQWALPRLGMRWSGFRRVRRQVCRRITQRMRELNVDGLEAYRRHLDVHHDEWERLDAMCRITISRFYRDRAVFDELRSRILPDLARRAMEAGRGTVRLWSIGCASGEEVYTLRILWDHDITSRYAILALEAVATDADAHLLERARRGCYPAGSLKEMPADLLAFGVRADAEGLCVRDLHRDGIQWMQHDVRRTWPDGPFDLVLCRNLVFTYFDEATQRAILDAILPRMAACGVLVTGRKEVLPSAEGLSPIAPGLRVYRRAECPT